MAVSRANHRLCKVGWLTRVSRTARLKATHWALRVPDQMRSHSYIPERTYLSSRTECNADFAFSTSASDVWRWGALGKSKARVYAALASTATSAALARSLCVNPRTVQIHLADLRKFLLVERGPDRCWRRTDRHPDDVARALAVFGQGDLRRQQHYTQRVNFRQYVPAANMPVQNCNRRLLWPLDDEPIAADALPRRGNPESCFATNSAENRAAASRRRIILCA
jgi:hypothetical protein